MCQYAGHYLNKYDQLRNEWVERLESRIWGSFNFGVYLFQYHTIYGYTAVLSCTNCHP